MGLRWITNLKKPDDRIFPGTDEIYRKLTEGRVIGDPVATEQFSVRQLKSWGIVGVYVEE